jgi:16S rRNA (cytosine967-C5)-methyltransferase
VKPGGLLLYSTCSVLREEDEDQVCDFLGRHADYSPDTSSAASERCKEGIMRSWPQQNGNDGFFAAKLRKQP